MHEKIMSDVPGFSIDKVTGFLDRNGFFAYLAQLPDPLPDHLTFIWIGIDRFKQINQSFGHHGGDEVINKIAKRIQDKSPANTQWGRIGGDEFVCVLSGQDTEKTNELASLLLREIELPLPISNMLLRPSASMGISQIEPDEDPFSCLERADRAMGVAKHAGGGRIASSGDESIPGRMSRSSARKNLDIENKLHLALENGGLALHYQPIIRFDGQIETVEALMRCEVNGENISPGVFIPVAEQTGLISRLGDWSLMCGAEFAKRMEEAGLFTKVSINVSRAQLISAEFSQALHAAFLCTRVNPDFIELELTESLLMDNSDVVQSNLRNARALGVKLAIDDFGTGYSCLANLKDIPASTIKLDRAFVSVLPEDRRAYAVVKALTQLGKELGMTVVAEGVEKQEQLDALREADVDAIQGYFHARPMPAEAMFLWLYNRLAQ